jgi:hypothetical protein
MNQPPAGSSVKTLLRAMQVVCVALMIGVTVFALVMLLVVQVSGPSFDEEGLEYKNIFMYVAAGLGLLLFIIARTLYKKKIEALGLTPGSLKQRLDQYRAALILYMAACEGAALFSVIVFFLVGDPIVLIVTAAMLAAMLLKFPFRKRVIVDLNLDWKEQQELE